MPRTAFLAGETAFLALAYACGGPPWTLVGVAAFLPLAFAGLRGETMMLAASSLVWLGLALLTGNCELFFPYSMQLATVVACRLTPRGWAWGLLGGGGVIAAFLLIRSVQQASPRVLAVELAVAAAILGAAVGARSRCQQHAAVDPAIVAASAVLACAGLLL